MDEVVARLRASKLASANMEFAAGFDCGQRWAKEHAEFLELQRIEGLRTRLRGSTGDWNAWFSVFNNGELVGSNAPGLVETINNNGIEDWDTTREFFEFCGADHDQISQPEFVRGFAEGALTVWDEVKGTI